MTVTTQTPLSMRTIGDLRTDESGKPQRYFIAKYQRGYRWSPTQVTQLLDDIHEFMSRPAPKPEQFYCLQPLVLKVIDDGYEVVDGQQRLTTIWLILRFLNSRMAEEHRDPIFTLEYQTRSNLTEFLAAPDVELAQTNPDFYHIYNATNAIRDWFSTRAADIGYLTSTLLKSTRVIWYLLSERENPVEAFTRLNVGKIPLTNDELIRALFLRRATVDQAQAEDLQRQIANEWDQMEKSLQRDDFWFFVSNQAGKRENRISLLFELVAQTIGQTQQEKADEYGVFSAFSRRLNQEGNTTKSQWREIKNAFMTLEEWFDDRTLYHVIGYLICERFEIQTIREWAQDTKKHEFENRVVTEVFKHITGVEFPQTEQQEDLRTEVSALVAERLDELTYEKASDHARLRSILLLFNIATLLENEESNMRFQFDSFKNQDWHIEHVRSVAPDRLKNHNEQTQWLNHTLRYLDLRNEREELRNRIESYLALPGRVANEDEFDALYREVVSYFNEGSDLEPNHRVGNLVLLDQKTNQSYKNSVFAVKRQRILELDRQGTFVPLCTRNVFLKCYSDQVDHLLYWTPEDSEAYEAEIHMTLVRFFCNFGDV